MKTTLITLLTAILLINAAVASGRLFDAADFIAIAFATGLVTWTVTQYKAKPRRLNLTRCIHLPVRAGASSAARPAGRYAA